MKVMCFILALLIPLSTAYAEWTLNNEQSRLSFMSIKKGDMAEVHRFKRLQGTVNKDGIVTIEINLSSVDTPVAVRDQRMQQMLFETQVFPLAVIKTKIDLASILSLTPGVITKENVEAVVSLHGEDKKLPIEVIVTRLSERKILVASYKPVILNASDFKLSKGVEALPTVVGLSSISMAVPVSFILTFDAV